MCAHETRFGRCAPRSQGDRGPFRNFGRTIVPCGGAAANCLGLTTQIRCVSHLTSGRNRRLRFGGLTIELAMPRAAIGRQPAGPVRSSEPWRGRA